MKRNLLLFLLSIPMLFVSVGNIYARTDCSGYKDTYPDHYCACNYDCTRIQNMSGLKNLTFNDSIWFKTTLKTFTEAGMTAYLFSESDVQVDIYQNCRTFNKMHQFTVSKNQTRDLDHQTILDKLEQNGASTATNTTIYVLFYPLEEGADCRLMCYPYNTGPNSTAADPLPVLIGMTYVSSHANDVYELKAEAIPTTYALYTQWKEENNAPCNLKVTRGSANGPVVAEYDFLSAETNFYFDPALLAEVKASGESLYMHYNHDASAAGRIQVVEGKVSEKTIDVTECQGKTYQIDDVVFSQSAVYTTMVWVNATTLEKTTYNIVFTEPEAQYDTLRVNIFDLPYIYREQFTIPVSGPCDYDCTIQRAGECDERVLLHVIRMSEEYMTICHGETYTWNGNTYAASGSYSISLPNANGCEDIVTLHLTVLPAVAVTEESATICHGETYTWNGTSYSVSGDYSLTLQDVHGCDSVVTLHLTVLPEVAVIEERATICHGETYIWQGKTYSVSGDYSLVLQDVNGCDSVVTLHLTVLPAVAVTEERATICHGETYTWNGTSYSVSGDYSLTLQDVHGCDSIVTLHLTVLPAVAVTEERATVCHGETYTWNGTSYSVSGDYSLVLQDVNGCDSVVMLHLTVLPAVAVTEESVIVCHGETYIWQGQTYSVSGDYSLTLNDVNGCDSVVTLHLTVLPEAATSEETVVACDSYLWFGTTYTESGDYTYVTTTNQGCEHTAVLHLTINHSVVTEETATTCDSYVWNGTTYTESGDYTFTTVSSNGCDSVVTLHLTVWPEVPVTEERATVCHGETYTWNGTSYSVSGDYSLVLQDVHGCDSVVTLHLTVLPEVAVTEERATVCHGETYTWNGTSYSVSGDYSLVLQDVNGCDSVVTLHLTVLPEVAVTEERATVCHGETYTWNGTSYSVSGDYSLVLQDVNGCDSVVTLHLTVLPEVPITEESAILCYGETYTWQGKTYSVSGDYTVTYADMNGCDSTFVLHLTILPEVATSEETVVACDSYEWHGQTYTESGTYTHVTTAVNGCEHTAILHLTINKSERVEETVTACDSYTWNGETYTESGDYVFETTTAAGCDRIETLHLTINKSETVEETVSACDSYEWNGETYTESGDYTYTTTTDAGCDRIETLHLTINKSETVEETISACDSYEWHGMTYTESGDYTYTTTTAAGCDRIETLHLTINKSETVEETVSACDSYEWHGMTYTESGDYTYTTTTAAGCDRQETLHLTINYSETIEETITACDSYEWHGMTYTESGEYTYLTTTAAGCDRTEILHLTIEVCSAVDDVLAPSSKIHKVLDGERIIIIRDGKSYTLMGQEIL